MDPQKDIRYISMKTFAFQYYGIAFYDQDKELIVSETFWFNRFAKWSELKQLPDDSSIMGLKCDAESSVSIIHLSFLTG